MPKSRFRRTATRRPRIQDRRPGYTSRSAIDLIRGVPGPEGLRIRLARVPDDGAIMLQHPLLATGLRQSLRSGHPPALPTGAFNPYEQTIAVSMLLAAADERDTVLGVLMALPPVRILGQFMQAGYPRRMVTGAAHTVAKLKGVAVAEDAQGRGIGTALIDVCTQIYTELGWGALYGQFDKKRPHLVDYYTRRGFTILGPREGIEFSHLVGFPLSARPLGGERMFVRWLNSDGPAASS
jgi:GNAT superfamily N-acetyltransferase